MPRAKTDRTVTASPSKRTEPHNLGITPDELELWQRGADFYYLGEIQHLVDEATHVAKLAIIPSKKKFPSVIATEADLKPMPVINKYLAELAGYQALLMRRIDKLRRPPVYYPVVEDMLDALVAAGSIFPEYAQDPEVPFPPLPRALAKVPKLPPVKKTKDKERVGLSLVFSPEELSGSALAALATTGGDVSEFIRSSVPAHLQTVGLDDRSATKAVPTKFPDPQISAMSRHFTHVCHVLLTAWYQLLPDFRPGRAGLRQRTDFAASVEEISSAIGGRMDRAKRPSPSEPKRRRKSS